MTDVRQFQCDIGGKTLNISIPVGGHSIEPPNIQTPINPANAEAYVLAKCAEKSSRILEIGTQYGVYTSVMGHSCPPDAKVIGLDLLPFNAQISNENLRSNGLDHKAIVLHTAGSTSDGYDLAKVDLHGESPGLLGKDGASLHHIGVLEVTQATIHRLRNFFGSFDMIKIDAEGFEAALLRGDITEIKKAHICAVEVHPYFIYRLFDIEIDFLKEAFPHDEYVGFYLVFRDGKFHFREMHDASIKNELTANLFVFREEKRALYDEIRAVVLNGIMES